MLENFTVFSSSVTPNIILIGNTNTFLLACLPLYRVSKCPPLCSCGRRNRVGGTALTARRTLCNPSELAIRMDAALLSSVFQIATHPFVEICGGLPTARRILSPSSPKVVPEGTTIPCVVRSDTLGTAKAFVRRNQKGRSLLSQDRCWLVGTAGACRPTRGCVQSVLTGCISG